MRMRILSNRARLMITESMASLILISNVQEKLTAHQLNTGLNLIKDLFLQSALATTRILNLKMELTARVELILPLSKSLKLKGSYGTAIKNPTFTERFGYYTNFIGNPDLQPEYSKNLELGFDFDLQNYNSLFSATLFKSRLVDEINGNFLDPVTFWLYSH